MDGRRYEDFFLQPQDNTHRRYEALRAVFVEGESTVEVADRLSIPRGTLRNWTCDFRRLVDADEVPPFFCPRRAAVLRVGRR